MLKKQRILKLKATFLAVVALCIVVVFSCNELNAESGAQFRKGPYLTYSGNNTEMTVLWQTDKTPERSEIVWGATTEYSDGSAVVRENDSGADEHQFLYTITGLAPHSTMYYQVRIDENRYDGSFNSAPYPATQSLSLYAMGDSRSNPGMFNTVISHVLDDAQDDPINRQTMLIHTGDIVDRGQEETYWDTEYYNRTYPTITSFLSEFPVMPAVGNHDLAGVNSPTGYRYLFGKYWPNPLYKAQDSYYYSFDYGPAHIAVVDQYTTDYTEGSAQYAWLENDLKQTNKRWKIVALHKPAWSAGAHENSVSTQRDLTPLFEKYGVHVVLQGHNHYYARCVVDDVQYVTVGGGGAPLYSPDPHYPNVVATSKSHSFTRFDIQGDSLEMHTKDVEGNEIDSFTMKESPEPRAGFIATTPYSKGGPQVNIFKYDGLPLSSFMALEKTLRGEFITQTGDINGDGYDEIAVTPGQGNSAPLALYKMDGTLLDSFYPFGATFSGGVNVLLSDLDNDGKDEIITVPLSAGGPNVRVYSYDGKARLVAWKMVYDEGFHGGVTLAAGDVDGDQKNELLTVPTSNGGPNVGIFSLKDTGLTADGYFFAYDKAFHGGVELKTAQLSSNGPHSIVTTPREGGASRLRVFTYTNNVARMDVDTSIYGVTFQGGVTVDIGDFDGDNLDEIVTAPATGGGPNVRMYEYNSNALELLDWTMAYNEGFHSGINLASGDLDYDGRAELIVAPRAGGPNVRAYDLHERALTLKDWFWAYAENFYGGVNVSVGKR